MRNSPLPVGTLVRITSSLFGWRHYGELALITEQRWDNHDARYYYVVRYLSDGGEDWWFPSQFEVAGVAEGDPNHG